MSAFDPEFDGFSPPQHSTQNNSAEAKGRVWLTAVIILLAGAISIWYCWPAAETSKRTDASALNLRMGLTTATEIPLALSDRFTDDDGDLVADPPKDSRDWIDPEVLVFSTL